MNFKLLPFQKKLLDEYSGDAVALFMDMGSGKTYTALGHFQRSGCSKLLIICLTSKIKDWHDLTNGTMLNRGTRWNKKNLDEYTNIISFESSWRIEKELLEFVDNDTYIIIDESHKIKNWKSKVGKFVAKLGKKTNHKAILTGTPQSAGFIDYFNQFRFLGVLDHRVGKFKERYVIEERVNFAGFAVTQIVGYKNEDELISIINENSIYYERDLSDEDLPSDIPVKFDRPKKYAKILRDRVYIPKDGDMWIMDSMGAMQSASRQLAGGYISGDWLDTSKLDWVKDTLDGLDRRVVLFYNYNFERDALVDLCEKLQLPYSEYNGRKKDLTNFKENSNGVVICNYGSASTGINDLVISHIMIMYSLNPSFIEHQQAKKRIDRLGQKNKPVYYYLFAKDTIDERIYEKLLVGKDFDENMMNLYFEEMSK